MRQIFFVTINLILFTHQGFPLHNSSLRHLHSDGDVSSLCSSSRRLLLVYFSAHLLHCSRYYPKDYSYAHLSDFWARGVKRSDWLSDPANKVLRNIRHAVSFQIVIDGDCPVLRCISVLRHPIVCNAWLHMGHPCPESFKDFPKKHFIDSLSWRHKFFMDSLPIAKKKSKWALIWYWIYSFLFSLDRENFQCAMPEWCFALESHSKTHGSPPIIMWMKNSGSLTMWSKRWRRTSSDCLLLFLVYWTILRSETLSTCYRHVHLRPIRVNEASWSRAWHVASPEKAGPVGTAANQRRPLLQAQQLRGGQGGRFRLERRRGRRRVRRRGKRWPVGSRATRKHTSQSGPQSFWADHSQDEAGAHRLGETNSRAPPSSWGRRRNVSLDAPAS